MGKEEVGWGEEYGDHKGRGCSGRKQRSGPRYRRGSRLRLLAPPRPPPSASCSRAREGQRPERQRGEEGAVKDRLAQKWRKKRVASVSKRRWRYSARHKGEGRALGRGEDGAKLRQSERVWQRKE